MPDNPYSPPTAPQSNVSKSQGLRLFLKSRPVFVLASFTAAWTTFYGAYAENVFTTPYLKQHMGLNLFTVWLTESLITSTITCAIICMSLFASPKIGYINYTAMGVSCAIEFGLVWFFFVAFFGV